MTIVPIPFARSLAAWLSSLLLPFCVFAQAPIITTPPESQSVVSGSNVVFSVIASGAAPLSYQWRLFGTNVAGRPDGRTTERSRAGADGLGAVLFVLDGRAIAADAVGPEIVRAELAVVGHEGVVMRMIMGSRRVVVAHLGAS